MMDPSPSNPTMTEAKEMLLAAARKRKSCKQRERRRDKKRKERKAKWARENYAKKKSTVASLVTSDAHHVIGNHYPAQDSGGNDLSLKRGKAEQPRRVGNKTTVPKIDVIDKRRNKKEMSKISDLPTQLSDEKLSSKNNELVNDLSRKCEVVKMLITGTVDVCQVGVVTFPKVLDGTIDIVKVGAARTRKTIRQRERRKAVKRKARKALWARENYKMKKTILDIKKSEASTENTEVTSKKERAEKPTNLTDPRLKFGIALPDFTASDRAHDKAIDWEKIITVDRLERPSVPARPALSPSDELIIDEALNGHGDVNDVIIRAGGDLVRRRSLATLRPRKWLNDEIISYYYRMLAVRDEEACSGNSFRRRCHLFNSFFITTLLNEGSCEEVYDYEQVRNWGDKVPGGDIFELEKIFIPINVRACHWVCAVVFMQERRIKIYDSFGPGNLHHLRTLFRYLQDEHQAKSGLPLPLSGEWRLEQTDSNVPRQRNGKPSCAELLPRVASALTIQKLTPFLSFLPVVCRF